MEATAALQGVAVDFEIAIAFATNSADERQPGARTS
jgi:hypothetical protein